MLQEQGFTVFEFLVSSFIGLIVTAVMLLAVTTSRQVYARDIARARLNQNLRSAFDIISADVKEAGENLTPVFPALELIDGTGSAPDELIIRRGLVSEIPSLCQTISATPGTEFLVFTEASGTIAGCTYAGNTTNFDSWQAYRQANGGSVEAYIYDISSQEGEFFDYVNEVDTGTEYRIEASNGAWTNSSYTVGSAAIYLLEEWHFQLVGDTLQLIQNGDTANPEGVVFGLTNFQVEITMQDLSTRTDFGPGDDWSQIQSIRVSFDGEDREAGKSFQRSMSGLIFPRNVMSF